MLARISNLPAEVRDRILSNLPTEEVVRTSILSSQWRKVCSTLSHYHFDQLYFQRNQGYLERKLVSNNNLRFRDVLMQTLSLHDIHSHIDTLKVNAIFDDALLSSINIWISFSVLLNIRELQLFFHGKNLRLNKLPCSFFTCQTLEVLTLRNIDLVLPGIIEFPNLKTLTLNQVVFAEDENETIRFFASVPVLEYLKMVYCKLKHPLFTLDSPKLKVLDLDRIRFVNFLKGKIRISSRLLTQILYRSPALQDIDFDAHSNLHHASFLVTDTLQKEYPEDFRIQTVKIFAGPYHIVKLALLGNCLQLLAKDPDLIYHLPTSSPSLKHLQLQVNNCTKNRFLVVTFLLSIFTNLETLSLLLKGYWESERRYDENGKRCYDRKGYRGSENLLTNGILKSLKIVTIKSLGGNDNEVEIVRFLLENASSMEKMYIEEAFERYWCSHKRYEVYNNASDDEYDRCLVERLGKEEFETIRKTTVNKIQSFTRASPPVVISFSPE